MKRITFILLHFYYAPRWRLSPAARRSSETV